MTARRLDATAPRLTALQLDALGDLARVASATAATALAQMLGREVRLSVPRALALPLAEAVEACGPPDEVVSGVVIPLEGDLEGLVLLLISSAHAATVCRLLGVEQGSEVGDSALCEIGNILGTSYLNALAGITGMALAPCPPHLTNDMLGAIVASLLAHTAGAGGPALLMNSELEVADEPCSISFLLLPTAGGAAELLAPVRAPEAG